MKGLESKYWALYRLLLVLVFTLVTNSITAQNLIKSATASIRFSKKNFFLFKRTFNVKLCFTNITEHTYSFVTGMLASFQAMMPPFRFTNL